MRTSQGRVATGRVFHSATCHHLGGGKGDNMSLRWADNKDDKGIGVTSLPESRQIFYDLTNNRLHSVGSSAQELYDVVSGILDETIDKERERGTQKIFIRPGFIFTQSSNYWNETCLSKLHEKPPVGIGYDEQMCGNFLGLLVYNYMIDSAVSWRCTKTQFNNREFETAVYWIEENGV